MNEWECSWDLREGGRQRLLGNDRTIYTKSFMRDKVTICYTAARVATTIINFLSFTADAILRHGRGINNSQQSKKYAYSAVHRGR